MKITQFFLLITLHVLSSSQIAESQLSQNHYAKTCPNLEQIVKTAVESKFKQTFVTVPATLRLFFHDCFVQGCDASVMIMSKGGKKAEKDHSDNISLAGDGFDTVIKARKAVDEVSSCRNKVSCADILALAARDVVVLAGGPWYGVELGRLDGLSSKAENVEGRLPQPRFDLDQLDSIFSANGLSRIDMIALSGAHTLGFSHCNKFAERLYGFSKQSLVDPTINREYAKRLISSCPKKVDPLVAIDMDPTTPKLFDNMYYKNLVDGKGLFTSDQILFTDRRSRPVVEQWAANSTSFIQAFVTAMTKLGRVGVKTFSKTPNQGNIRLSCDAFNS